MSLGSNLKQIRLFRNKTLKELGQGLGFPFSSADVRICLLYTSPSPRDTR